MKKILLFLIVILEVQVFAGYTLDEKENIKEIREYEYRFEQINVEDVITKQEESSVSSYSVINKEKLKKLHNLLSDIFNSEKAYDLFFSTQNVTVSKSKVTIYDKMKNITEETTFDRNNKIRFKKIFKYDKLNQKIEAATLNSDNTIVNKELFKYDTYGNLVEEQFFDKEKLIEKHNYKYDDKRNKTEYTSSGENNSYLKYSYIYNKNGNKEETKVYKKNNILCETKKYDKNGNEIEVVTYNPDFKWLMKYNTKGSKTEMSIFDGKEKLYSRDKLVYDENENLIENATYNSDGTLSKKSRYKYFQKTDKINPDIFLKLTTSDDSQLDVTIYGFDKKENWNKQILIIRGLPWAIIKREIIYFD